MKKTASYILLALIIAMIIFTFVFLTGSASVLMYAAFGMVGYIAITVVTAALSAFLGIKFAQMLSRKGDKHGKD